MTNECKIELIWSYLHKYFVNRNRSRNKCFTVHYDWVWTILAIQLNSWIIIHDLHLFTPHTCILLSSALRGAHQFFLNLYQTYKTFMNDRYYSSHYFSDKNVKSLYLPTETDITVLILTFCLEILCLVFSDQFWHIDSQMKSVWCVITWQIHLQCFDFLSIHFPFFISTETPQQSKHMTISFTYFIKILLICALLHLHLFVKQMNKLSLCLCQLKNHLCV